MNYSGDILVYQVVQFVRLLPFGILQYPGASSKKKDSFFLLFAVIVSYNIPIIGVVLTFSNQKGMFSIPNLKRSSSTYYFQFIFVKVTV